MVWSRSETLRVYAAMKSPLRLARPEHDVTTTVQGVPLTLPRAHMLPVYARIKPRYGQNLVELAAGLAEHEAPEPLRVVDVGANVGDSALQIVRRSNADVLCVEGDPYWARYLHRNVDGTESIVVEEALLVDDVGVLATATSVRKNGTSRFVETDSGSDALPHLTPLELRRRNPRFDHVRLIKSDTDGYDTALIGALAATWRERPPVLFFEFDPELTRRAGNDPNEVWAQLSSLGYQRLTVWDNAGDPLGRLDVAQAAEQARTLEPRPVRLGYHFWDVAACHVDDVAGLAVLDRLVPMPFDVQGRRTH